MRQLRESGMDRVIPELKVPVLGICLGMQLMCAYSEEGGSGRIGIFPDAGERIRRCSKVPHMGWNGIRRLRSGLFDGVVEGIWCISYIRIVCLLVSIPLPRVIIRWLFLRRFVKGIFGDASFIRRNRPGLGKKMIENFLKCKRNEDNGYSGNRCYRGQMREAYPGKLR